MPWFCSCLKQSELDRASYDRSDPDFVGRSNMVLDEFAWMIEYIVKDTLRDINQKTYAT